MAINFKGPAKRIEDRDLPRIGREIGVGEDEIHAVMEVEAAGSGFDSQGRPKMLFEPHIFDRLLRNKPDKLREARAAGLAYPNWGAKPYPKESYTRLERAMQIDETAALKAASWGLGQILGDNHVAAGYPSPQAMVKDFTLDEDNHLEAMIRFIKAKKLDRHIRSHAWAAFANGYNGPQYAKHNYHGRLAAAFAKWQRIRDTPYDPDAPEAAERVVDHGDPKIENVQRKLAAMGYFPGKFDGKWGTMLASAIGGFKNDYGVVGSPEIDDALIAALDAAEEENFTRPISEARANATASDIAEDVPIVRDTWWSRWAAKLGMGGVGGVSFFGWISEQFETVRDNAMVQWLWGYAGSVRWYVWLVIIFAILTLIWWKARKAEGSTVKAFQEGRLISGGDQQ